VITIAGGFAGGGNSNNARKRYVRKSERESGVVGHISFPPSVQTVSPLFSLWAKRACSVSVCVIHIFSYAKLYVEDYYKFFAYLFFLWIVGSWKTTN
jgi:hypothetical protein